MPTSRTIPGETAPTPRVSVIIATYQRSNVLRLAIESVRRSTIDDFEILVVDDASTDDTEAVVSAIDDPRIRYLRLQENFGEQSGPNNVGLRAARAPFVAFLNHDDLYFADHLERSLAKLEATGADLVFAFAANMVPLAPADLERGMLRATPLGATMKGRYKPYIFAPASLWVLRRSLAEALGGFRRGIDLVIPPSQDLLFRAHKAGYDLRRADHLGVVVLASGRRPDVYRNRETRENELYAQRVFHDPGFREALLGDIAMRYSGKQASPNLRLARRLRDRLIYGLAHVLNIHPSDIEIRLRIGGRGSMIRRLRQRRGLDERLPPEPRTILTPGDHGSPTPTHHSGGHVS